MNEPECWLLYLYCDTARRQADYVVSPYYGTPDGAVGSNWRVVGDYASEVEAKQAGEACLAESLADGWSRDHQWNYVF